MTRTIVPLLVLAALALSLALWPSREAADEADDMEALRVLAGLAPASTLPAGRLVTISTGNLWVHPRVIDIWVRRGFAARRAPTLRHPGEAELTPAGRVVLGLAPCGGAS